MKNFGRGFPSVNFMSASVLVWFAVKNPRRMFLYPVAIVLHTLLDMIAAFGNSMGLPIMLIELLIYIYAGLTVLLAVKIWKKEVKI